MNALRQPGLPSAICNEIARLKGAGFPLLPLGGGTDGKAPLSPGWATFSASLAQVLAPLHRSGSRMYGIRLDGLAVVDCDTDDPALVAELEARFGQSAVHVRTPRGLHLFYRLLKQTAVPNLRGEGLPVDIKTGTRSYVAGPLSERPDGGVYTPAKGLLGIDALAPLKAASGPLCASGAIPEGHRHNALVKEAMKMVELVDSGGELFENLRAVRDNWCADPATFPDSELEGIARWTWQRRLEGNIFQGRDSAFRLNRLALDALQGKRGGSDAIALYASLLSAHGHVPGMRFPLDFSAMRQAGRTDLSVPRLRAARRLLESVGLLRRIAKHRAGITPELYVLLRLRPAFDADNVAALRAGEAGGEGLRLLMTSDFAPKGTETT